MTFTLFSFYKINRWKWGHYFSWISHKANVTWLWTDHTRSNRGGNCGLWTADWSAVGTVCKYNTQAHLLKLKLFIFWKQKSDIFTLTSTKVTRVMLRVKCSSSRSLRAPLPTNTAGNGRQQSDLLSAVCSSSHWQHLLPPAPHFSLQSCRDMQRRRSSRPNRHLPWYRTKSLLPPARRERSSLGAGKSNPSNLSH